MSALIPRKPDILMVSDPDGTASGTDISCYVRSVDHQQDPEELDISTFCEPSATDVGKVTDTLVLSMLWSPEMFTAMSAENGNEVELQVTYNEGDASSAIFRARWASIPMGTIEAGTVNEFDLPCAVLASPTYEAPTIPAAAKATTKTAPAK